MRYQSFYPFANQPPQPPPRQQVANGNFQPFPSFSQRPQESFAQNQPNQQTMPYSGDPYGMGQMDSQPPGGIQQGKGPSKPEMYMETANRLITTVQQYAPIVQQFAPMIQNIPAMWKLYRGFQSLPSAGAAAGVAETAAAASVASPVPRPSVPKVFQPPI